MEKKTLSVLIVEPQKKPYAKEIGGDLKSLQREVGGYIQAVYPFCEPVALICDDEGKLSGKALNRALRDEEGQIYDVVAGTFLIAGLGEEDFISLTPEQMEHFMQYFQTPEQFRITNSKILVSPMGDERSEDPPVYRYAADYAMEHGEIREYNLSYRANEKCKKAIQQAISRHYDGSRLRVDEAVKEVLGKFREDRVQYILANTVQRKSWDGRISPESKAWAQTISIPNDNRNAYLSLDDVNPGLMDSFLKGVRESIPKKKKHEKTAEKKERKPSYER